MNFSNFCFFTAVIFSRWPQPRGPPTGPFPKTPLGPQAPAFVPSWNLGPKVRNGRNLGDILGANESPGVFLGNGRKVASKVWNHSLVGFWNIFFDIYILGTGGFEWFFLLK